MIRSNTLFMINVTGHCSWTSASLNLTSRHVDYDNIHHGNAIHTLDTWLPQASVMVRERVRLEIVIIRYYGVKGKFLGLYV